MLSQHSLISDVGPDGLEAGVVVVEAGLVIGGCSGGEHRVSKYLDTHPGPILPFTVSTKIL